MLGRTYNSIFAAPTNSYQFNPSRFDMPTTVTLLTKLLMGLPDNDFTLVGTA